MDVPSSSNVTGRRKRTVNRDSDDDSFGGTPIRRVRGTRRAEPQSVVSEAVMQEVNSKVDEIVNRRKIGATNCFDFKSPLELYGIEQMIEAKASIQEMAVVLESAQVVMGYRVDRLHHDVRTVDAAISGRDMTRIPGAEESVALTMENRKAKKKMAISDGLSTVSDFLQRIDDGELIDVLTRARQNVAALELPEGQFDDLGNAGDEPIDMRANSKDVDLFMQRDVCLEALLESISRDRAERFRMSLAQHASPFISPDDATHDLKDCEIDWLKSNATFQKATKGSIDNTATSFHSLNYFGTHSPSGRMLVLHPRIRDKNEDDRFYLPDCTVSLANNVRCLLGNALEKKPAVLDNYLMLEARDRPVIGKYKIMSKEVKKSTLPLAEAARERDLANLTFAEMTRANSIADTTIAGSSDISMLPGHQALPLADVEADETVAGETQENTTISTRGKAGKDEYPLPSVDALALEESLIGRLPMDPLDMDDLLKMYDQKVSDYKESDAFESKLWKNGLRAEEWGDNDEAQLKKSTRNCISSGIEGWMKAVDVWTNYEPAKLHITRETMIPQEEEGEPNRTVHPGPGNYMFLVKSDEYMNNYPGDRTQEFKMVGEELDVMKMIPGVEGVEDDRPLEEIQREIRQMNEEPEYEDIDDDYDAPPSAVEFNETLVAPADTDDYVEPVNREDDRHAEFEFNNIDEPQEEIRDERVIQREIENIALGANEVAELMTARPGPDIVGPSAEQREEIRNIGKADNRHWIPPEVSDNAAELAAQKKKREKKLKAAKKSNVEEYTSYFRDFTDIDERERECTANRCQQIADNMCIFLPENNIYMSTLGTENKPHIAVDLNVLTTSGLFFKTDSEIPQSIRNQVKQKSFGKLRLERTKKEEDEEDALFAEDNKGNREADCLSWLLTFSGFKCMENPVSVSEADKTAPIPTPFERQEEEIREIYFDDEYDRYNPRQEQQAAFHAMGEANQKKLAHFSSHLFGIQNEFRAHRDRGFDDSDDDEFEDSFDHQSIQTKNLDAAKHKRCLADILNNQTLSMPCIQYALEQLTLSQQSRKNNTTVGASTSMRDASMHSPGPYDPDATLKTVFDYNSPAEESDVKKILDALTDITTYGEAEAVAPDPNNGQSSTSKYGTANTENRKFKINGFHTLLSLALSMPPKMGESVKPSSIVSFILHVANENSLKIVQDRSKKAWMTDFVVLNHTDNLPSGLKMGNIDEQDDFWRRNQDPDAIEGSAADQAPLFSKLIKHAPRNATAARKGRAAAIAARPASPVDNLEAIAEEEEMEE